MSVFEEAFDDKTIFCLLSSISCSFRWCVDLFSVRYHISPICILLGLFLFIVDDTAIHRVRKKGATLFLPLTLPNTNRSPKLFQRQL